MTVAISNPLRWLGGQIDIKVEVATVITPEGGGAWDVGEWDDAVWSEAALAFHDISQYLERLTIRRGQQRWDARFDAGTATFIFNNKTGLFTPNAGEDPWSAPFRPGRLIRVLVIPDPDQPEVQVARFTGRIDSSNDVFSEGTADIVTVIHAIDALGDLHDHNPPALETATGVEDTDERVTTVLDRMAWPSELRSIQPGFHTMQTSFLAQTSLEECQRCADAEGGSFYANGDGVLVFKNRDWLLGGSPLMSAYEQMVLSLEPVAYWRFSGAAATADETGNGHTLTWDTTPTTQQVGVESDDESVLFDGADQFATVASEAALELAQDMSIEAWVFVPDGETLDLIWVRDSGGAFDYLYGVSVEPDPALGGWFSSGVGFHTGWPELPTDQWVHFVMTIRWDVDSRQLLFYVDGVKYGPWITDFMPVVGSRTVRVGRSVFAAEGNISELAVYDKVLSDAEVLALYNAKDSVSNERSVTIQGYIGYGDDLPVEYDEEPTAEFDEIETNWERKRVRNDIQFARDGGSLQQVEDSESQTLNGVRSYPRRDFHNNSDAEVLTLAERNLAAYKDARPRIDTITIVANDDPENEDLNRLFWDTRFGDMVSVKVSTIHGWSYTRELHVIGIEDEITGQDWKVKFVLDDSIIAALEELEES